MLPVQITPENSQFVILCFEGPDRYSMAGGLGVRVVNIASTLTRMGFMTHFFFVGNPKLPGEDFLAGGKLILHRWCQWISEYHPQGVYEGEEDKLSDFNKSIPGFVIEKIILPAAAKGKITIILAEEWHTAEVMCRLHDDLVATGIRDQSILFWNVNNTFSFYRIPWQRLKNSATITTVSRYMKHALWGIGINPLVVPNGIPSALLRGVSKAEVERLRDIFKVEMVLSKVARWDPAKGWDSAVETVFRLKQHGIKTTLLARGGMEPHGEAIRQKAEFLGLKLASATLSNGNVDYVAALQKAAPADIIDIRFSVPLDFLRIVYRASNAVLANSRHEPFGIVGLETMAVGGIAFTGSTGEEYAIPGVNAFVMDTDDAREIESSLLYLRGFPEEEMRIRRAAKATARNFTWEVSARNLLSKIEHQARLQGFVTGARETDEKIMSNAVAA
jgi:glycosyltransferase involved in cell wall biosynthesis